MLFQGRVGRARVALGVVLATLAVLLVATDGPISGGVGERLALGRSPNPIDYWNSYGWPVAVLSVLVLSALAVTVPRWIGPPPSTGAAVEKPRRPPRLGVALVLGAMLTGGWLGLPRLSQSLWDDEAMSASNAIHGLWRWDEDRQEYRFRRVPWSQTFFGYPIPNNHVPNSILARASVRISELLGGGSTGFPTEAALRAPAFVFGVLAIGALALFLFRLGFGSAGVVAAWLLAMHPWMVRYLSEARGYTLAMLSASLLLIASFAVLREGRWSQWLAYGASQVVLLWVFPPVVYFVAAVNLAVLGALWRRRRGLVDGPDHQLVRFLFVNGVGALLWLTLMVPNLVQLLAYLDRDSHGKIWMSWSFVHNLGAHFLAGMDFRHGGAPLYPELADLHARHPVGVALVALGSLTLLAVGIVRAARRGGSARDLLPALCLPGLLSFAQLWAANDRVYIWYFVFYLPFLLALIAMGATWGWDDFGGSRLRRAISLPLLVAVVAAGAWIGEPARTTLRSRAYFPLRESVLATRPVLDPNDPRNKEILTGSWASPARYYDPRHRWFVNAKGLRRLMREADTTDKPLFINLGRLSMAERRSPKSLAIVRNPRRFERIAELPGFTPRRSRVVFRYLGRPDRESADDDGRRAATEPGR